MIKVNINVDNLEANKENYDKINLKLEELLKLEPTEKIKKISKEQNWSIDRKEAIIKGSRINKPVLYRIEFYHDDNNEGKSCYLGCIEDFFQ